MIKRYMILMFVLLAFCATPLLAQVTEPEYPARAVTAGFAYNQYASGTLPVQMFGSLQEHIAGPLYSLTTVDVTATPVDSPDGLFKVPTLQFSFRQGALVAVRKFGKLDLFLLADAGFSSTKEFTIGSFTGGGGGAYRFSKHWAVPVIFRANARTSQDNQYIIEVGLTYIQ